MRRVAAADAAAAATADGVDLDGVDLDGSASCGGSNMTLMKVSGCRRLRERSAFEELMLLAEERERRDLSDKKTAMANKLTAAG